MGSQEEASVEEEDNEADVEGAPDEHNDVDEKGETNRYAFVCAVWPVDYWRVPLGSLINAALSMMKCLTKSRR